MPSTDELTQNHGYSAFYVEDGLAPNSTWTVEQPTAILYKPHFFLGITFYAAGSVVSPTAGTFTIEVETWNNPGVWQAVDSGTDVDATAALSTLSVAGNVKAVRYTPTSVSGNSVDEVVLRTSANQG